jgi:hypothetical protein
MGRNTTIYVRCSLAGKNLHEVALTQISFSLLCVARYGIPHIVDNLIQGDEMDEQEIEVKIAKAVEEAVGILWRELQLKDREVVC